TLTRSSLYPYTTLFRSGRFDEIDAVGAGEDPRERGCDAAAHEVGAGADVCGRHVEHRDVAAGVLPHRQRADRLQAGDQDDQVDHDRQDGPSDEEVGELHQLSSGLGAGLFEGCVALFTATAAPLRSLKTPDVTTSSPGAIPDRTATWSPRALPILMNCWRTPR